MHQCTHVLQAWLPEYFTSRDVTMNEVLIVKQAPGAAMFYYTRDALRDVQLQLVRAAARLALCVCCLALPCLACSAVCARSQHNDSLALLPLALHTDPAVSAHAQERVQRERCTAACVACRLVALLLCLCMPRAQHAHSTVPLLRPACRLAASAANRQLNWGVEDNGTPFVAPSQLCRCLVRYLKGHGLDYALDATTWAHYRRERLNKLQLFKVQRRLARAHITTMHANCIVDCCCCCC